VVAEANRCIEGSGIEDGADVDVIGIQLRLSARFSAIHIILEAKEKGRVGMWICVSHATQLAQDKLCKLSIPSLGRGADILEFGRQRKRSNGSIGPGLGSLCSKEKGAGKSSIMIEQG